VKERQLEFEDLLIRKAMEREAKDEPPPEPSSQGFRFLNALRRLGRAPQLSRERTGEKAERSSGG
jgi:hypothetical protein